MKEERKRARNLKELKNWMVSKIIKKYMPNFRPLPMICVVLDGNDWHDYKDLFLRVNKKGRIDDFNEEIDLLKALIVCQLICVLFLYYLYLISILFLCYLCIQKYKTDDNQRIIGILIGAHFPCCGTGAAAVRVGDGWVKLDKLTNKYVVNPQRIGSHLYGDPSHTEGKWNAAHEQNAIQWRYVHIYIILST